MVSEALGEREARGMSGVWQGLVKRPAKSQQWLARAAVGSDGGESGKQAEEEKMGSKCSNLALAASG